MSVALIDYGSGNLHSAAKAVERAAREAGIDESVVVTSDPEAVGRADRIVLPGVGAFADCRRGLDAIPGLVEAMTEAVRGRGRPFFGICVGMQLMATRGLEYETTAGLDWIGGDVQPIRPDDPGAQDPAYGLEHPARAAGAPASRRHRDRPGGPACLLRPFLRPRSGEHGRRAGGRPITAGRSRPSSPGTTWPAPSSIPRRARRSASS